MLNTVCQSCSHSILSYFHKFIWLRSFGIMKATQSIREFLICEIASKKRIRQEIHLRTISQNSHCQHQKPITNLSTLSRVTSSDSIAICMNLQWRNGTFRYYGFGFELKWNKHHLNVSFRFFILIEKYDLKKREWNTQKLITNWSSSLVRCVFEYYSSNKSKWYSFFFNSHTQMNKLRKR